MDNPNGRKHSPSNPARPAQPAQAAQPSQPAQPAQPVAQPTAQSSMRQRQPLPRPVRLEDVAKAAHVSLATASKALRGQPRVSPDTRQRVLDVARQLGYHPSRSLPGLDDVPFAGMDGSVGTTVRIHPIPTAARMATDSDTVMAAATAAAAAGVAAADTAERMTGRATADAASTPAASQRLYADTATGDMTQPNTIIRRNGPGASIAGNASIANNTGISGDPNLASSAGSTSGSRYGNPADTGHNGRIRNLPRPVTIGLVVRDLAAPDTMPILVGAEHELHAHDVDALLTDARGDALLERSHVSRMLQRGVDGILVIRDGSEPQPSLSALRMIGDPRSSGISSGGIGSSGTDDISDIGSGTRTPFVYAFGPSDDPADRSVVCDNIEAGRAAVAHLVSCGRRHIAIIGGGETSTATADRVSGALAALESYDLKPAGPIRYGVPDETWGRAAIRLLIDQGVEFDAVICHSDRLARGCMEVLERRRMRVPQDVAVVGYGDRAEFTQTVRPALTSIDPNLRGVGARAAQRLIEAINAVRETAAATAATATAGVEAVECRLIQRGSTLPIG